MIKIIREITSLDYPYYFAVSMGVDSVAAYLWMRNKGYDVTPIHFNHRMRIQNDLMEAKFVELCEATNKNPIIGRGNNLSTEANCREARLSFYKEVASSNETVFYPTILTAHHLNDCVESYLLNCFRGKPTHNFFELVSEFPYYKIAHPFLISCKKDFNQYIERNNYSRFIVEDETNSVVKGSRRNWIRNNIIPEMKDQKISLEKYCLKCVEDMVSKKHMEVTG